MSSRSTGGDAASLPMTTRAPEFNHGTFTTWLPLTTQFTAPAGCDRLFWKVVTDTLAVWDPGYALRIPNMSITCQPAQVTTWWNSRDIWTNADLRATQYSIGPIVCPAAYTTATAVVDSSGSTLVACCPR